MCQQAVETATDTFNNDAFLLAQNEPEQAPEQTVSEIAAQDNSEPEAEPEAASEAAPETAPVTAATNETEPPASSNTDSASPSSTGSDIPGTAQGRNYHVIVASFASAADANSHASSITDSEISAYVIPPFGGSNNYRVAVANYRSMAEARQNIAGLQAVFGSGIWPLRYPPSPGVPLISSRSGATYIIVASFPNEQLARSHAGQLVQRGEQPAIIAPYPPANRYRVAASYYDSLENAEAALGQFRQNYGADAWLLRY